MPLSADRVLQFREAAAGPMFGYPVQSGSTVYRGSIVALCADQTIVPAESANTGAAQAAVVGLAQSYWTNAPQGIPNTLSGATQNINCRRGTVQLPFDVAPTAASVGHAVYAVDDQTVSLTQSVTVNSVTTNRLQVGTLVGFDASGPWVQV